MQGDDAGAGKDVIGAGENSPAAPEKLPASADKLPASADKLPASADKLPASPVALFIAFTLLALQGFGGVIAVAQRVLVEQKRWLTRDQFIEILSFAQVLPGPNVCNVALIIGDRFFGWRGAFAALGGMMLLPLMIVLGVAALYAQYASEPAVAGAFRGMGAVAAGLIIGTALKLASALGANPMGVRVCGLAGAAVFFAVAVLRLPLVWVLLVLGSLAGTYAWTRLRAREPGHGGRHDIS